jgi:hypothetical protein
VSCKIHVDHPSLRELPNSAYFVSTLSWQRGSRSGYRAVNAQLEAPVILYVHDTSQKAAVISKRIKAVVL